MDAYVDNLYLVSQGAFISYIVFFLYNWLIKRHSFFSFLNPKLIGVIVLGIPIVTAVVTMVDYVIL